MYFEAPGQMHCLQNWLLPVNGQRFRPDPCPALSDTTHTVLQRTGGHTEVHTELMAVPQAV